jgi:hypothetical protein
VLAVPEALDPEHGNRSVFLLLTSEEVLRAQAVADGSDADAHGVGGRAEEGVERNDLVHLAATYVHVVGDCF